MQTITVNRLLWRRHEDESAFKSIPKHTLTLAELLVS